MDRKVDEIIEIMSSDMKMKEKIDKLPFNLLFSDVKEFFAGVPDSTLYKMTSQPGFPRLKTGLTILIVPRSLFLDWYFHNIFYQRSV